MEQMSLEHEPGRACWCGPRIAKPCPECGGDDPTCWRCDESGLGDTTTDDTDDVLVIHVDNTGLAAVGALPTPQEADK